MGFSGPDGALQLFGITLIGATPENGQKLLLTACLIVGAVLLSRALRWAIGASVQRAGWAKLAFWLRQAVAICLALFVIVVCTSLWFDDPERLTTAAGLVTAGLAFAMQRVVTAVAGYVVILRGKTFNVGDRITMGGVRGDVIALDFTQTTILEMGQTGPRSEADPDMWVRGRQYTGRIVTVTNAKIFEDPVYNYSREFPYIFDELGIPMSFDGDLHRAEAILLDAAGRHAAPVAEISKDAMAELQRRYFMSHPEVEPRVYWRLTDNGVQLTLRFLTHDRGSRDLKDRIVRDVLAELRKAGVGLATASIEHAALPPQKLQSNAGSSASDRRARVS